MTTEVKVTLREELVFLLNHAAELEHSLCCSYYFTALSLKSSLEEGLTEATLPAVKRWKRVLSDIAIEEMMHLAIVNNLLVAVGAAPHFDRPNFPHDCPYFMPDLEIGLRPFSEATLRHFIAIEQPEGGALPLIRSSLPASVVEGELINEIGPDAHNLESQGEIYTMIVDGLRHLVDRLGEENVFVGPPARPAVKQFFENYGWEVITDLASADRILQHVVEQGEGGKGGTLNSHHAKFEGILNEYIALKAEDASFSPMRPLLSDPFSRTPPEAQGPVNLITDDFAIKVSDLFNEGYVVMLNLLGRFFVTTEETERETTTLGDAAIELMRGAVLPLGELLAKLPSDHLRSGFNAGPSFVVRTLHALPHKGPAWHVMRERVEELSLYAGTLAAQDQEAAALQKVQSSLARVGRMLTPK